MCCLPPRGAHVVPSSTYNLLGYEPNILAGFKVDYPNKLWTVTHVKLKKATGMWQCVKGPVSASIATLIDAGWKPVKPMAWIAPTAREGCIGSDNTNGQMGDATSCEGHDDNQVLHRLTEDLEEKLWQEASSAHNGEGLQKGKPNFGPAANMHAKFVRQGDFKKAKAVELVTCNKVWSKQRLLDAKIITEQEAVCSRCHGEIETDYHKYYGCKANDCIESDDVIKTNWLKKRAKEDTQNPCLWLRAILPGCLTSKPVGWAPDEEEEDHFDENFTKWLNDTGKAGTDGTGGIDGDPRTRRVFAGAAVLNNDGSKVAYMQCKVRGENRSQGPN